MGQACTVPQTLNDSDEDITLPVLQLSTNTRPRPKKKAKPKADPLQDDLVVQGKLLIDSWALSPKKLCLGGVPIDQNETVQGIPASIFVPLERHQDEALPPKPPFALIKAGKPDFTGNWICSGVSGDMDDLMTALEVSWARRTAARCINYGKGIAIRQIAQRGNEFIVDCLGTPSVFQQRFHVGRGAQETAGPNGKAILKPVWEHGYVLSIYQTDVDGTSPPSTWKQYFDGEDLVFQMLAPNGDTGFWRFSRR
uniref:Uncharacterized protein n=1 Tax=Alexandrium catenella TaxID=2925 RepID=A0A7S1PZ41_ALECA